MIKHTKEKKREEIIEIKSTQKQRKKIDQYLKTKVRNEMSRWAVDQNNKLYWLQVRPITTLSNVHPNELDSKLAKGEVLTRAKLEK